MFADRAKRGTLWCKELEGWDLEESEFINEMNAIAETRGFARGYAKGWEEAEKQVEGAIRTSRASVLRLGSRRFGMPPSAAQLAALDAIVDLGRLEQFQDRILDVPSWDELLPPG